MTAIPATPPARRAPVAARHGENEIRALLGERILVMDGATGTEIQARNLAAADFGGAALEGCNEHLVLTRPDVVEAIHRSYLEAGADVVETDTFGATPLVLAEYGIAEKAYEINRRAAEIAAAACRAFESPGGRPRLVAGSIGPTTKTLSVSGGISFEDLASHYAEQARGLVDGGADILLVETAFDTANAKAALVGIERALAETGGTGAGRPVALQATIDVGGTMLAGQTIEAFYASVEHANPLWVGMNCAVGPAQMRDPARTLAALARTFTAAVPNAGLPDAEGGYRGSPEEFARTLAEFLDHGWLNVVGGCCGTGPAHVRLLAAAAEGKRPRRPAAYRRTMVSGVDLLSVEEDRPYLVGERTNVLGSRKFKRLVAEGKWEEAAEVGRAQARAGAHVLDVCLQDPDRDEASDVDRFLDVLVRAVRLPLMIDTTDARVLERALAHCQGKAIVNSINLEDGEERFRMVCPLLRRYGAAVVVGCIDDDPAEGQARTLARKVAVAERSHRLLTSKYGVPGEDIVWDPLVFPAASGDAAYAGAAYETLEAIRALKARFPETKTVLGISNVSFGLQPAAREVLNAVFLHRAVEAGLDLAIANAEALVPYAQIPEEDRRLCEALLLVRYDDPDRVRRSSEAADALTARFRDRAPAAKTARPLDDLPVDARVSRRVVEGTKEGQAADLDALLAGGMEPLAVINGPLMRGMDEVGRLFAANELIVAEVLRSAEVMKASVSHLEPHLGRASAARKGKVLLATVKGDVHDIGKNLVEIIFANNGFEIVNLGIKVPPETIVEAVRTHRPAAVGLSGLLVKSAHQMVATAEDMRAAGIEVPILVGGAALTAKFTETRIRPAYGRVVLYAKDAMAGLSMANRLVDPAGRAEIEAAARAASAASAPSTAAAPAAPPATEVRSAVRVLDAIPRPPDLKRRLLDIDAAAVYDWVNPQMLLGKHLGIRGSVTGLIAAGDPIALELKRVLDDLSRSGLLRPRAVWRFLPAVAKAAPGAPHGAPLDAVEIFGEDGGTAETIVFPRQRTGAHLCLADYVRPFWLAESEGPDYVALFVTTAGAGVREHVETLKARGDYLRAHALAALALETAEASAEWLHAKIREAWGIGGPGEAPIPAQLQAKYRGKRYSFGYPACPHIEDQAAMWRLLRPEEIGVALTEGWMMDPEASVSAVAFHHPEAAYFAVEAEP